jgi:hypothetical protein
MNQASDTNCAATGLPIQPEAARLDARAATPGRGGSVDAREGGGIRGVGLGHADFGLKGSSTAKFRPAWKKTRAPQKKRRHHNTKGTRQVRRGKTAAQVRRMAYRLGLRYER